MPKPHKRARSAVLGRFAPKAEAERNKAATILETAQPPQTRTPISLREITRSLDEMRDQLARIEQLLVRGQA